MFLWELRYKLIYSYQLVGGAGALKMTQFHKMLFYIYIYILKKQAHC